MPWKFELLMKPGTEQLITEGPVWDAEYLYFTGHLTFDQLKGAMAMFPPEARQQLMGMLLLSTYVRGYDADNSILYTSRLRLKMDAKMSDQLDFAGRLSMYKAWGDSTGVQVFNGQPTSMNIDGTTAGVPNSDLLRVDRAYFTWKDIAGLPLVTDMARMPHLLVAGATGAGKSVSINTMILSLLYTATPNDVRLIMVDPKMLELSIYEGIPHLLLPVVTNPKKASLALKWAVEEMGRRYRLMADKGVRNIDSYNKALEREVKEAAELQARDTVVVEDIEPLDDEEAIQAFLDKEEELEHGPLPYIVVIVDELADLMMVAGREIEESIARLAQMARAAGIHLILATQRPSVDVITGLIKANFPARISFQVSSKTDSRTILDCNGAEALLGAGDMLFLPPGTAKLQRAHGAFVSDAEVQRVVDFLKKQGKPVYDKSILEMKEESAKGGGADEEDDPQYDAAVALVDARLLVVAESRNVGDSLSGAVQDAAADVGGLVERRPRLEEALCLHSQPDADPRPAHRQCVPGSQTRQTTLPAGNPARSRKYGSVPLFFAGRSRRTRTRSPKTPRPTAKSSLPKAPAPDTRKRPSP